MGSIAALLLQVLAAGPEDAGDVGAGAVSSAPVDAGAPSVEWSASAAPEDAGAPQPARLAATADAGVERSPSLPPLAAPRSASPLHASAELTGVLTIGPGGQAGGIAALHADLRRTVGERTWVRANLAARISAAGTNVALADNGSSLELGYRGDEATARAAVYPLNPARVRPAFDWVNAWGSNYYATGTSPVVQVSLDRGPVQAWLAARGANFFNNLDRESEVRLSFLGGAALALPGAVVLELRGAAVDRGLDPTLASQGIRQVVIAAGGSGRLSWSARGGVGPAFDLVTYASDPERYERLFEPERYDTPAAASVSLEGTWATQRLQDPDTFAATRPEPAGALDLQVRVRRGGLRLFGTARLRSLTLIVFDVPGLVPYAATGAGTRVEPELSAILAADYRVAAASLAPGLVVRVARPASAVTRGESPPAGRTTIVHEPTRFSVLPAGRPVMAEVTTSLTLRADLADVLVAVASLDVEASWNRIVYRDSASGVAEPVSGPPVAVSGSVWLQLRY